MEPEYIQHNIVTFKSKSTDDKYYKGDGCKTVHPRFVSLNKFNTNNTNRGALVQPSDCTLHVFLSASGHNHMSTQVQKGIMSVFESLEATWCSSQQ